MPIFDKMCPFYTKLSLFFNMPSVFFDNAEWSLCKHPNAKQDTIHSSLLLTFTFSRSQCVQMIHPQFQFFFFFFLLRDLIKAQQMRIFMEPSNFCILLEVIQFLMYFIKGKRFYLVLQGKTNIKALKVYVLQKFSSVFFR